MLFNRYRRPAHPSGRLWIQGRDVDILRAAATHRFIQAEHVHGLIFRGRTLRVVQIRLRKLWEHRLLERHFAPFALDGIRQPPSVAATPTYSLGARGAEILARASGQPASSIAPTVADNQLSSSALAHHVTVTDLLAALEVRCREHGGPELVELRHEWPLWRALRNAPIRTDNVIVPDGAFTLRHPARGTAETWYVEIVRASVQGGNDTFRRKMLRYAELQRAGAFAKLFGDRHVRGVLVATPTVERAANLRALSVFVPGRRFFAFSHFEDRAGARPVKRFRPEAILDLEWLDGAGETVRLGASRDGAARD